MRIKYPRTYHLPYSMGTTSDDKILKNDEHFIGKQIVVTEKMDGENTTIYRDYIHARSIDSKRREYHSWLHNYAANFQYELPESIRICGEYLYAKHSISYADLSSYFLGFSAWEYNTCLNWSITEEIFKTYKINSVPVLYTGIYDGNLIQEIAENIVENNGEGLVVRLYDGFHYDNFATSVAKFVRANHVQTDKHWTKQEIIQNKLGV